MDTPLRFLVSDVPDVGQRVVEGQTHIVLKGIPSGEVHQVSTLTQAESNAGGKSEWVGPGVGVVDVGGGVGVGFEAEGSGVV